MLNCEKPEPKPSSSGRISDPARGSDESVRIEGLLQQWAQGDRDALDELAPAVYPKLRRLAHRYLRAERADHTLQSTALVNEAFVRLIASQPPGLRDRGHFVAVASRVMRQILVEHARSRRAFKRDGGCRVPFECAQDVPVQADEKLVELDDALKELAHLDERQARVVEMKFFGGFSAPEIAQVLGVSLATVERDWATARIWLRRQMTRSAAP